MADMFKPKTSGASLGNKKTQNGQFQNPPEYPAMGGFTGSSKTGGKNDMTLQKTPTAKNGR